MIAPGALKNWLSQVLPVLIAQLGEAFQNLTFGSIWI
jgi:hypothetical protein